MSDLTQAFEDRQADVAFRVTTKIAVVEEEGGWVVYRTTVPPRVEARGLTRGQAYDLKAILEERIEDLNELVHPES